ncbi:TerD family protein [Streptomyces sp. AV19]|uniref:TerD family protein n=1 Tax=Streptomyces sp. AV19 TaxID=2793068 RepID=UPI0018FE8622|nr:TerD family protein [Streptomyces sp. AV19]MBH1938103.1 TerD family protein [Streptomyces sp. AV19]MDG4536124.1 TerD family protein [Streptomyces sp. AV19]
MSGFGKGIETAQVRMKWDPAPFGATPHDLDLIGAVYATDDPYGPLLQIVHFGSRSTDGTVFLNRDSRTGQGLGWDEVMTMELSRMPGTSGRVVIGVAVRQAGGAPLRFADVANPRAQVVTGYEVLAEHDFKEVAGATAATVAEFARDGAGLWTFRPVLRGFDTDAVTFAKRMGAA